MSYRRRASPLHAAGAGAAVAWCLALGVAALLSASPLVLGALALTVALAAVFAGVGQQLRASLRLALPLCLSIALINALVSRSGLTVIWRFGTLPLVGQVNVTLEATVYGLVLGLRAVVLVLLGTLYSLAVDPDEVLRLLRRASFRSALSATVATRMVPVLMRDSRRLREAQRCRPGPAPGRLELLRASTTGALDRALDIAATLEVRGYGSPRVRFPRVRGHARADAGGPAGVPRTLRLVWSKRPRHELAFAASAACVLAVSIAAAAAGLTSFTAYPLLELKTGPAALAAALLPALVALLPFADRRGVGS
ncbi:MAG TPA: energy-coupling factor transporter transmembrane component T [Solirubrobacteraceae bacterium]|nr:energy-coupling factor transporter transmembrane component T [Solirubrobacteraceae bacterium]